MIYDGLCGLCMSMMLADQVTLPSLAGDGVGGEVRDEDVPHSLLRAWQKGRRSSSGPAMKEGGALMSASTFNS